MRGEAREGAGARAVEGGRHRRSVGGQRRVPSGPGAGMVLPWPAAGDASTIIFSAPIWSGLLAWPILGERWQVHAGQMPKSPLMHPPALQHAPPS